MTLSPSKRVAWTAPWVAVGGLALYLLTLSRGAYPGESAALMAGQLGLNPLAFDIHLLWDLVCRVVLAMPLGSAVVRLNVLSAVCAAGALWLAVRVVAEALWMAIDVDDTNRRAAARAATLGGLAAGLFLMVCMPFWHVGTRFHVAAFDLLLLLALTLLLLSFVREPDVWKGVVFGLAYGIVTVEFPSLVVFGPPVAVAICAALWAHEDLRWGRVLPIAGSLLAGLLLYGVTAWRYLGSPVFALGTPEGGYGQALYEVLRMHFSLIARSLPQLGWLLVILVGVVPWLAVLLVGRRGLNAEKDWGLYILHFILTAVAIAVLFNAPFAPWALMGAWRLLVTPYLLLAAVFGYLTAYWFLLPRMYLTDDEDPRHLRWRDRLGWVPALALLLTAATAGVVNFPKADARAAGAVNDFARAVVESVGTRSWLLTDGAIDDNLLVAAHAAGRPLHTVNLRLANNLVYRKSIGEAFQDARLRSLAQVDLMAFLRGWMDSDTNFANQAAFMMWPDLWLSAGFVPVPDRAVFAGVRKTVDIDPEALWPSHEAFWDRPFVGRLQEARNDPSLGRLAGYALRHLSMVANNLGVAMEDATWQKQAYAAYARARSLDTNNVSALLNQVTMIDRGYAASDAEKVRAELKAFVEGLKSKMQIWSLARTYGYVRTPQAYADMGMVWALSGSPGMAVAGFQKAIELDPAARDMLTYGLASAYLAQDQSRESEALYRQLLEKNPNDTRALVGMARLLTLGGRADEAAAMLDRAGKVGLPKDRVTMEYAVLYLAAGDLPRARIALQELTDLKPDLQAAWAMLAALSIQQKDAKALDECERKLERAKDKDFLAVFVLGQIALQKKDTVTARVRFDQAQMLRPASPHVLVQLLQLDIQEGREDLAGVHVRNLLLLDPDHPFANHVLGSLQLKRKEYALAENSLRKSVERGRSPDALNDLAWVLQERGALDEAEKTVREALAKYDKAPPYWDTLGVILMKRGALGDAEAALKQSVALFPDDLSVQTHLAQLYAKKGDAKRAAELAEDLLGRGSELSLADRERLRELVRRPEGK